MLDAGRPSAEPYGVGTSTTPTSETIVRADRPAFGRLRNALGEWRPLVPLDPGEYAAGHALFESRSDQREHLTDWLVQRLAHRADAPSRVLSIGCGDGSVDVRVAGALAARGHRVDYVGVEPHRASGHAFARRLRDVPGVDVSVLTETFEQSHPTGRYDVVLAVHSLYYVTDLADTLRRACRLLASGGELIVLHAPLEPLNALVRLLAPGHRQDFGDEVAAQFAVLGRTPTVARIDNQLDLTPTGDAKTDRQLIEFTVQAEIPPGLVTLVRAALSERSLPVPGLVLTHPVDAFVTMK